MLTSNLIQRAILIAVLLTLIVMLVPVSVSAQPPQQGGGFIYYVRPGDTLFWISQRFGTPVPAIMSANGLTSDYIQAGQRLIIPAGYYPFYPYGSSIYAPQPLPPITPQASPTFTCTYGVRPGDTVYSIAYRYRVTVVSLMQANNLYSPLIFVNQQIKVPCNNSTPDPFPTYTVTTCDNLFRIAVRYNTTIWALALVNGIPNPNLIFVGQSLVIPYPNSYVWQNVPPSLCQNPTHVVMSQFRTRGPNGVNDEFIELYNPTSAIMNVSGWLIKVSTNNGTVDTRVTINSNVNLNPGQHYLITNNASGGYNGSVGADQSYGTDIPDDGGIALTLPDGTIIDQFGMSAGSAFKEGTILAPLTATDDRAYERRLGGANGNCQDANNNAADFAIIAPSTPRDLASAAILCANPSPNPPPPQHVVISQFRTRGPNGGNDEFVEIYNPTNVTVNASGWIIRASNVNGTTGGRLTFPANTQLNPGQHYLIGNSTSPGYAGTGSATADQTYTTGITDDGGIALTLPDGTIVDQVGMSNGSVYKEGTPLAPLATNDNRAHERKLGGANGNCQDTNNNAADFTQIAPSTPRNSSVTIICVATSGGTITPGPSPTFAATATSSSVVSLQNNSFNPATLTITRGTKVIWKNNDTGNHTVTSGVPGTIDNKFRSGILVSAQTFEHTFTEAPGTYQYFCEIHGQAMTASITVQ